jgi:hypothetical protein
MNTFKLSNGQLMMMPDELAYDLKLIPEPAAIEANQKAKYILLGASILAITWIVVYQIYLNEIQKQETKYNR